MSAPSKNPGGETSGDDSAPSPLLTSVGDDGLVEVVASAVEAVGVASPLVAPSSDAASEEGELGAPDPPEVGAGTAELGAPQATLVQPTAVVPGPIESWIAVETDGVGLTSEAGAVVVVSLGECAVEFSPHPPHPDPNPNQSKLDRARTRTSRRSMFSMIHR